MPGARARTHRDAVEQLAVVKHLRHARHAVDPVCAVLVPEARRRRAAVAPAIDTMGAVERSNAPGAAAAVAVEDARCLVCDVGEGGVLRRAQAVAAGERPVANPALGGADGAPCAWMLAVSGGGGCDGRAADGAGDGSQRSGSSANGTSGLLTRRGSAVVAAHGTKSASSSKLSMWSRTICMSPPSPRTGHGKRMIDGPA